MLRVNLVRRRKLAFTAEKRAHLAERQRKYRIEHPDYVERQNAATRKKRHRHIPGRYGISIDEYKRMYAAQAGLCGICGRPETFATRGSKVACLSVDHDHTTGKVRALLCAKCNKLLGQAGDDFVILWKAMVYLELFSSDTGYLDHPAKISFFGVLDAMASSVTRRQRLKEAGLCSQCRNPPVEGRSRCQKHLDKANALARNRNAERKRFGLCIRCPEKAQEGHVLCATCLESLRHREVNWAGKRDRDRGKQQVRMAAGLCRWCDNSIAAGRTLCEEHLKIEREKVRVYRAERKAKGLCWRCDEPARPGGVLCQKHREAVTAKERARAQEATAPAPPAAPPAPMSEPTQDHVSESRIKAAAVVHIVQRSVA
jgi:Recombination endonuclease VII